MIWGCDPASKKIALFTADQAVALQVKRSNRNLELFDLRKQMEFFLARDRFPIIYCEEPVVAGARNLRSTILIAETVGMILSLDADVRVVPVSSWKKGTVGNGNAAKSDVADWLRREYPEYAELCGDDQDLIDSAAIYLYGVEHAQGGSQVHT